MPKQLHNILEAFGLNQTGKAQELSGGMGGSQNIRVDTDHGPVVVKSVKPEDEAYEAERSRLQEAIRNDGVPVTKFYQTPTGDFLARGASIQTFVEGARPEQPYNGGFEFGEALGKLDRALTDQSIAPVFTRLTDIWARGRSLTHIREHYVPIQDNRFPAGYDDELLTSLEMLESHLDGFASSERVLSHVDPNPGNTIQTPDNDLVLIDLTLDIQFPGYTLGAAIYWWAYPWQTGRFNPSMASAIASGYRSVLPLEDRYWRLIATHILNHGLMALALPFGVLADGNPYKFPRLPGILGRQQKLRSLFALVKDTVADV